MVFHSSAGQHADIEAPRPTQAVPSLLEHAGSQLAASASDSTSYDPSNQETGGANGYASSAQDQRHPEATQSSRIQARNKGGKEVTFPCSIGTLVINKCLCFLHLCIILHRLY